MKRNSIDREGVKILVDSFYLKVRETPELKTIFEREIGTSVEDWQPHLETMYGFWGSVLLQEKSYRGNPIAVHRNLPYFPVELFIMWLSLFRETAQAVFSEVPAQTLIDRSETIARSLKSGIYRGEWSS